MIILNLLIKPIALFGIDATVQNRVGPENYGLYFSLLNLSVLFNILLDFGINNYTTKNLAQNPVEIKKYFGRVFTFRIVLFSIYSVFTFSLAYFLGYSGAHVSSFFSYFKSIFNINYCLLQKSFCWISLL